MVDVITYAIGELASYLAGLFIGRAFSLEPKRARRVGEIVLFVLLVGVLVAITVIYA